MADARLQRQTQALIGLMDRGHDALARRDAGAIEACAHETAAAVVALQAAWEQVGPGSQLTEDVVVLAGLLRDALERVDRNWEVTKQWIGQTQDALRAMKHSEEAIGRYADGLGAHRRELFDLSA